MYGILDKAPPGKVYIKVVQSEMPEKLPMQLNDALTKLQSEREILDKKMANKSKSAATVSTHSDPFGSSDSCSELRFFT